MTIQKRIMLACCLSLAVAISAQDAAEIRDMLDNERYGSAETILSRKIAEQGSDPDLNYMLVKVYLEQDKESEAKKFVEQYHLDRRGDDASPLNRVAYGRYLLSAGDKEAAIAIFEELLDKRNKKDPAILIAIAEAHIEAEKGDATAAIELLDLAAKRDKKNVQVEILKGNAYRKLKDASNAFLSYQAALEKDPDNVKALFLLGNIFVSQKNPDVYMEHFGKAYALDSTYAPVQEALYDHYYFRDVKKAKLYLEKYIANSDYSPRNDYRLTDMYYLNKEYDKAISLAKKILDKEKDDAQPRLYKLIAYSTEATGDSAAALDYLTRYFEKEDASKLIAPDYETRARLVATQPGREAEAAAYYARAIELDSLAKNKIDYAIEIARLYKEQKEYSRQAKWLGNVYHWKERPSNVDLFNWGIAHYNAAEYILADSVFLKYTIAYPENIYGYFWRAQVNAAIDTSMSEGLAIPFYKKVAAIGEKDKATNKTMLLKAYGYLGGYEANTTKQYGESLAWFEKSLELDPGNADVKRYIDILKKWMQEEE